MEFLKQLIKIQHELMLKQVTEILFQQSLKKTYFMKDTTNIIIVVFIYVNVQ